MLFRRNLKKASLFCTKNAWKGALPLFWTHHCTRIHRPWTCPPQDRPITTRLGFRVCPQTPGGLLVSSTLPSREQRMETQSWDKRALKPRRGPRRRGVSKGSPAKGCVGVRKSFALRLGVGTRGIGAGGSLAQACLELHVRSFACCIFCGHQMLGCLQGFMSQSEERGASNN